MTSRIISFALALAVAAPLTALAQEGQESERGQLLQVSTFSVDPAHAGQFETAIKHIAEAAGKANTPYKWAFLQDGSQYTLVYPIDDFAYFDDPMQFVRSFMGTEGESQMQEAMASFETMNVKVVAEEIAEEKAEWSYEVEGWDPTTMTATHWDVMWLKPGAEEKFAELNEHWSAFFGLRHLHRRPCRLLRQEQSDEADRDEEHGRAMAGAERGDGRGGQPLGAPQRGLPGRHVVLADGDRHQLVLPING
jgi:hypothetical protein